MAGAASPHPTLFEVLKTVHTGQSRVTNAAQGRKPVPFSLREGSTELGPDQLCWARIPIQRIKEGKIDGYQRHLNAYKARQFARHLQDPAHANYLKTIPAIEVSITNGQAFITDGQHRAAGAVIAGKPIRALLTKRTMEEARQLFAGQAKASRVNRNILIFDGDDPIEEYIQDAVTDPKHPWNPIISTSASPNTSGGNKISATAAYSMLQTYVMRDSGEGRRTISPETAARFDKATADGLATLLAAFGTRRTNPLAWSSTSLRAIAKAARAVFRDRDPDPKDKDRWTRNMPRFNFASYAYIRSSAELSKKLVEHWNKGLPAERRAG